MKFFQNQNASNDIIEQLVTFDFQIMGSLCANFVFNQNFLGSFSFRDIEISFWPC